MDTETKMTIKLGATNPQLLKKYLIKRYQNEINQVISRLTDYYNERVDIRYTFEDSLGALIFDLDFYFVENKAKYPLGDAGGYNLPVCFVISPAGYSSKEDKIIFPSVEYVYKVAPKKGIIILYKQKVNGISWKRLFDKAIKSDLNQTKIFKGKTL